MSFKIFGKDSLREKIICAFATAIFSAVLMVYFCAQNTNEITAGTAAILSCVMFFVAVLSFIPSLIIFRRAFTAMVFCVFSWLGFYLTPLLYGQFFYIWPFYSGRAVSFTICIFTVAFLFALLSRKIHETVRAALLFIGVLLVVFVMNLNPLMESLKKAEEIEKNPIPVKENFFVDSNSKSPNIYWIHPDGMLGVDGVKKYFGEDQKEFLTELKNRGFEINPSANFEARHSTTVAVPILLNPEAYDKWFRDEVNSKEKLNEHKLQFLTANGEFPRAFFEKNYNINVVGYFYFYYLIKNTKNWMSREQKILTYEEMDNSWVIKAFSFNNRYVIKVLEFLIKHFSKQDYQVKIPEEKLKEIFINGWDPQDPYLVFAYGLYDSLYGNYPSPKLTFIHEATPHFPFTHDFDGKIIHAPQNSNPVDYYPQHVWSAKILIKIIDMILEKDPEAVIVIQADHGIHSCSTEEEYKAAFGEKANAREIWNGTMSALRVPEKFKTGEEFHALETPLNMSRYLVNSFVGKNYEYLKNN